MYKQKGVSTQLCTRTAKNLTIGVAQLFAVRITTALVERMFCIAWLVTNSGQNRLSPELFAASGRFTYN
jgi:hypothetical protein